MMHCLVVSIKDGVIYGDSDLINRPISSFFRNRISSKYTRQRIDARMHNTRNHEESTYTVRTKKCVSKNDNSRCYEKKETITNPPVIYFPDLGVTNNQLKGDDDNIILKSISGGIVEYADADSSDVGIEPLYTVVDNVIRPVVNASSPDDKKSVLIDNLYKHDSVSVDYVSNRKSCRERSYDSGIKVEMRKEFSFGYLNSRDNEMAGLLNEEPVRHLVEHIGGPLNGENRVRGYSIEAGGPRIKRSVRVHLQSNEGHEEILTSKTDTRCAKMPDYRRDGSTKFYDDKIPNVVQQGAANVTHIGKFEVPPYAFALEKLKSRFATSKDQNNESETNDTEKADLTKLTLKWLKRLIFNWCRRL
ncbi:hypothetical protein BBBOND_0205290 [Babesia bigemina]|uniref:Uncharacterized protein n=1 Tax=Babesia bigemina TaxID=5866 RepID=A0A061D3T6_BABBI|nr:hypothetical protein BBBOND_0205290 [Babesia bigemina]CDR95371.1 hypothetical protein BBBOND_0205290 [Babesia bigemina]|eukprot:XP_012767557.1 hypothetical protein BBBOND_0205290 [Babesia bigemina]